jgi:PAS domain S-box-containing protein
MKDADKNHDLLDYIACSVSDEADDAYRHEAALIQIEVFEAMVQNCAVAIFAIDSKHRVIHWNKACEELTGIPCSQVLGTTDQWSPFYEARRQTLSDLIVDGDMGRMNELYTSTARRCSSPPASTRGLVPRVGGRKRYLIFDAAPIHHRNGELLGAVETLQDITALKEMEEERSGSTLSSGRPEPDQDPQRPHPHLRGVQEDQGRQGVLDPAGELPRGALGRGVQPRPVPGVLPAVLPRGGQGEEGMSREVPGQGEDSIPGPLLFESRDNTNTQK